MTQFQYGWYVIRSWFARGTWKRPWCWLVGHRRKFGTVPRMKCIRCNAGPS